MMFPATRKDQHVITAIALLVLFRLSSSLAWANNLPISRPPSSRHLVSKPGVESPTALTVSEALELRYACTRFERYQEPSISTNTTEPRASIGDPAVIETARKALDLSRRAPSGFNVQPYKLLLISNPKQKEKLAKYCLGRNADRVRDSDCVALFLADRESMRLWPAYKELVQRRKHNRWQVLKLKFLVGLFSSGLTLPPFIVKPITSGVRFASRVVSWFTRAWFLFPTLSNRDTWSQKNTMLVAMSYMLECTSQGLATCPMEGYLSWGVRNALGIPRRYTIPLAVATGRPFVATSSPVESDDAGLMHGPSGVDQSPRFAIEQVVFENFLDSAKSPNED